MSLDETITRLLRSRSDAIDRNIQSLLRGNRVVIYIYIYKIKKDDGDITAAYVNESLKRGMESECIPRTISQYRCVANFAVQERSGGEGLWNGSQRVDVTR